jgi:hypothetical protein
LDNQQQVDPYRAHWLAVRQSAIQHVRLHRVIAATAPPEAGAFIRDLIAATTRQIRIVEGWTDCRPWDGS